MTRDRIHCPLGEKQASRDDFYVIGVEEKKALLAKAYRALPEGGAIVVYEAIIR